MKELEHQCVFITDLGLGKLGSPINFLNRFVQILFTSSSSSDSSSRVSFPANGANNTLGFPGNSAKQIIRCSQCLERISYSSSVTQSFSLFKVPGCQNGFS